MRLVVYKQSGEMVNEAGRQAYDADFRAFFDKAEKRAEKDMLKMNRFLRFGEKLLYKKHAIEVQEEVPKTAAQWMKLLAKYGDTPIAVAKRADKNELILIVMDLLS